MEKISFGLIVLFVISLSVSSNAAPLGDGVCGGDDDAFPSFSRDIVKRTCVDNSAFLDPKVNAIAFAWVDSTAERTFAVLADYKNWPKNICNVTRTRVRESGFDENGIEWKTIAWIVKNPMGETKYTNRYFLHSESEPKYITFNYVGPGDVDDIEGIWDIFTSDVPGVVLLRYRIMFNPDGLAPIELVEQFMSENLDCLLGDLREWAERDLLFILN